MSRMSHFDIHRWGALQIYKDLMDHLKLFCCLLVIRAPKVQSLLLLNLSSTVTLLYLGFLLVTIYRAQAVIHIKDLQSRDSKKDHAP